MAAEEPSHSRASEAGVLVNDAKDASEDTNPNPLLRYLQRKGRVADAAINSDGETGEESRGASDTAPFDDVPRQPITSDASEREALLKYMSRRGITLEAPVALAEFISVDEYLDEKTPVIEGRIEKELSAEYVVDMDGRTTAENLIEAADELNEAARPLKYALGDEAGSALRESICADVKRYLRDKRPGIRLVARAAQRFLKFDEQMRQEEHAKAQRIIKEKHELKKRQEEARRARQNILNHGDEGSEGMDRSRIDSTSLNEAGTIDVAVVEHAEGGAVSTASGSPKHTSIPHEAKYDSSTQDSRQGALEKQMKGAGAELRPDSNGIQMGDSRLVKFEDVDACALNESDESKVKSPNRSLGSLEKKLIGNVSHDLHAVIDDGASSSVNATGGPDEYESGGIVSSFTIAPKSRIALNDDKEATIDEGNSGISVILTSPTFDLIGDGIDRSHASTDGDAANDGDGEGDGSSSRKSSSLIDDDDDDGISGSTFEQFRGYSLLESKLGGTYLGINLKTDKSKQFSLVSMHLEDDGVPYESMLWNLKPDGSLESKVDGLVLQVTDDGESTVICGQRKSDRNGVLKASCKWTYTSKGELVHEASEYLLTIRNGSRENFTEVWCNYRPPKVGKFGGATKAQRWIFNAFNGEFKPASSAPEILSEPTTTQAVKHHLKFLLGV